MKHRDAMEAGGSGCREIDGEHDLQIELLTAFRRAVSDPRSDAGVIAEILDRLSEYTKMHFASEQLLMRLYSYPQYAQHAADHDVALQQLQTLLQAYADGRNRVAAETVERLVQALTAHIRSADQALGRYLLQVGIDRD
jgi:hemerythrin-like metal-binding protein